MSQWNDEIVRAMMILAQHHKPKQVTKLLNDQFNTDFSYHAVRAKIRREKEKNAVKIISTESRIAKKFEPDKLFTEKELLEIHGYDPDEFVIDHGLSNEWQMTNKEGEAHYNFQSKIKVKPKGNQLDDTDIINILTKDIKPIEIPVNYVGDSNLVIPLADLHFGITQIEDTLEKLDEIKFILSKGYKTIVIEQLGDLFHSSQMKSSQTLRGTLLDDVDMVKAIEDAKTFYDVIITSALEHSKQVIIEHAAGNHSGNMEYMFLLYLKTKYPDITVNKHNDVRTAYLLDNVGIMLTHGDNAVKKLPMLFATEFKLIWSKAETMEIHTGHYHTQEKDFDGITLRQMGTIKPNDYYEVRNGWTNGKKVIQLIEYSEDRAKGTYEI